MVPPLFSHDGSGARRMIAEAGQSRVVEMESFLYILARKPRGYGAWWICVATGPLIATVQQLPVAAVRPFVEAGPQASQEPAHRLITLGLQILRRARAVVVDICNMA